MGIAIPQVVSEDRASGAQIVDGSLRFDVNKKHYLKTTPSSSGNGTTWTFSAWIKLSSLLDEHIWSCGSTSSDRSGFEIPVSSGIPRFSFYNIASSSVNMILTTSLIPRDYSSFYHVVIVADTTSATSTERLRMYINGSRVTNFSSATYPSQNTSTFLNQNTIHSIGIRAYNLTDNPFDGYINNFYLIDGQALDASYFGYTDPLTNVWRPKKFSGTLTRYTVPSGFSYWTAGMTSNWASSGTSTSGADDYINSALPSSGKYYWETTVNNPIVYKVFGIKTGASGIGASYDDNVFGFYYNSSTPIFLTKNASGTSRGSAVTHGSSTGTVVSNGDVIMWAWDADNDKIWFGRNGTWYASGDPALGSNPSIAGEDLSASSYYLKIGRTDYSSTLTLTNKTSGSASYFNTVSEAPVNQNTFYLPFDGSAPIGQDQSGRGNNWTSANFGGSNTIEKATGALPILNTDGGGKVARVGVRTDANSSSLVLALPLVGIKSDFSNAINSGTSNKAITAAGNATASSTKSNFYGGSFYFDGTGDYLTIPDSSDFDFGSGEFTVETWINTTTSSGRTGSNIFNQSTAGGTSNSAFYFGAGNNGTSLYLSTSGSSWTNYIECSGEVDDGNWHHIAWQRRGNTLEIYVDGVNQSGLIVAGSSSFSGTVYNSSRTVYVGSQEGSGDFNGYLQDFRVYKGLAKYTSNFIPASTDPDIVPDSPSGVSYSSNVALVPSTDGAVAFDGSGDYLNVSSAASFNPANPFTVEFFTYPNSVNSINWLNSGTNNNFYIETYGTDIYVGDGSINSIGGIPAPPLYRWTHVAVSFDGTTIRCFYNGILQQSSTSVLASNTLSSFRIGAKSDASRPFNGFISNLHVTNNALYTSNFTPPSGPISSVANTKLLCCKSNSSATAADVTPGSITANGNATASNFNPFTANINTQRGKQSGYATFNPLDSNSSGTLSNGNLQWASAADSHYSVRSTLSMKTGKWYAEGTVLVNTNSVGSAFGIALRTASLSSYVGNTGSWSYHSNGNKYLNGGSGSSFGTAYGGTVGNVVGLAFDADNGNLDAYLNGVYQGRVVSGLSSDDYFWMVNAYNWTWGINFGQKPFKFPPPAGFQPLTLANTPRPTIVRPDQYVGISTWTGNDANNRKIVTNFKPDLFWAKSRSSTPYHSINDSVRGPNAIIQSNTTSAEQVNSNGYVTTFVSDGVTITNGSDINSSSYGNYVGWAWKAGGSGGGLSFWKDDVGYATASAAGLTAGTISPTGASVGTKQGFSIIKYSHTINSPQTIAHGLTKAPEFILAKFLDGTTNWNVYHASGGGSGGGPQTGRLILNSTAAYSDEVDVWNDTAPTNQVWTVGGSTWQGSGNHITYLWHSVPGFSKFGSYVGNSNTDGPVIITGFKPKLIIMKATGDVTGDVEQWIIRDSTRSPYNVTNSNLYANLSNAEDDASGYTGSIDILSNGFKLRGTYGGINGSTTYIYAAWAESPTFNLYGAQANAR
jgi:hypothetical protein